MMVMAANGQQAGAVLRQWTAKNNVKFPAWVVARHMADVAAITMKTTIAVLPAAGKATTMMITKATDVLPADATKMIMKMKAKHAGETSTEADMWTVMTKEASAADVLPLPAAVDATTMIMKVTEAAHAAVMMKTRTKAKHTGETNTEADMWKVMMNAASA